MRFGYAAVCLRMTFLLWRQSHYSLIWYFPITVWYALWNFVWLQKKKKIYHNINIYPYRLCQSYNAWHCLLGLQDIWSYWFDHLILLIQKSKSVFRVAWLKLVKVFSSCMQLLVGLGGQAWRLTLWTAAAVSSLFLCFLWIVCYFWMFYRIKLGKFTFNKDKTGSSSSPYFYFLFFKCCLPFSFLS